MINIDLYPVNNNGEKFPIQFHRPAFGDTIACSFLSHVLGKTYVDAEDFDYLYNMAKLHDAEIIVHTSV